MPEHYFLAQIPLSHQFEKKRHDSNLIEKFSKNFPSFEKNRFEIFDFLS